MHIVKLGNLLIKLYAFVAIFLVKNLFILLSCSVLLGYFFEIKYNILF